MKPWSPPVKAFFASVLSNEDFAFAAAAFASFFRVMSIPAPTLPVMIIPAKAKRLRWLGGGGSPVAYRLIF